MAKGQKRSNREAKKPKANKKAVKVAPTFLTKSTPSPTVTPNKKT